LLALVAFATSFAWTIPASATLLPAGTFPSSGNITAVPGLGGGGTLVDSLSVNFASPTPVFSGNLTTNVIRNDSANPFGTGSGFLTFTYQLSNFDVYTDPLERLTLSDFNNPLTNLPFPIDVSYSGAGTIPESMDRKQASGKIVGINFFLEPGNSLRTVVIHTALTNYRPGVASILNTEPAGPLATFVPIPEPSSLVLAALGLGGILLGKRRRSQLA